ncbi:hypothetical protein Pcinc_018299 [Petrolisthes cinctipes]|uniref:Uncharacterized protein n=1 Tax=Petrolisthes cinctipes TaxID=88211 RepID=A0AAE1FSD2_PETCI|nr:hypothetical protein Pcinc_018299 [Petrolisthes cinctipes]
MGLNRNTVKLWVQRYEAEGHVMTRMRPGRPRLTTPEQDAMIVAAAHESPLTTAIQITRELDLPVTPQVTRKRLRERGISG